MVKRLGTVRDWPMELAAGIEEKETTAEMEERAPRWEEEETLILRTVVVRICGFLRRRERYELALSLSVRWKVLGCAAQVWTHSPGGVG